MAFLTEDPFGFPHILKNSEEVYTSAMPKKPTVPCALLGAGRIGSLLETDKLREKPASHAGAIFHNPDCYLLACADPDPQRQALFSRQWNFPASRIFSQAEELFKVHKPGVVHIACDTDAHLEVLKQCLDQKIPVIVLEKPLGKNLEESEACLPLVQAAEKNRSSRIIVNHERRFARDYKAAKAHIQNKSFGELLSVQARLYMGKTRKLSQVLWHDATHLVDILRFLAGPWSVQQVEASNTDAQGNLWVLGRSEQTNALGFPIDLNLEIASGREYLCFEIELNFSKGRLRLGNGVYEEWISTPSRLYEHFYSLKPRNSFRKNPYRNKTAYFINMMKHAVQLYKNPQDQSESSYLDGLEALRILNTIEKAAQY